MMLKTDLKVVAADLRLQASLGRSFPCGHDALAAHAYDKAITAAENEWPIAGVVIDWIRQRATEYHAKMLAGEDE